jgi:hypothetical protein
MEKIKIEDFEKWAKEHDWLKTDEISTVNGHQSIFLTPAGQFIAVIYNINGKEVSKFFPVIFTMPQPIPRQQFRPFDPRGGATFPG